MNALSTTCISACMGVTEGAGLFRVMFEAMFEGVIGGGLSSTPLSPSLSLACLLRGPGLCWKLRGSDENSLRYGDYLAESLLLGHFSFNKASLKRIVSHLTPCLQGTFMIQWGSHPVRHPCFYLIVQIWARSGFDGIEEFLGCLRDCQVFSISKAFGGNTRDLGSFGEEMDKTTDLHQHLSRLCSQRLETESQITRDAVTIHTKMASQDLKTASECTTQPII
ncbi:hypothetical protein Tco_0803878 [Tanacetum coccineum]|uniref:Uncharacterized protein n=1 Tax=Tanacetum coccineum TaxID=301880 RepID=A0ABQ5A727_9ASTR